MSLRKKIKKKKEKKKKLYSAEGILELQMQAFATKYGATNLTEQEKTVMKDFFVKSFH